METMNYKNDYTAIVDALRQSFEGAEGMYLKPDSFNDRLAPYMQFVGVDFLKKEDWPHNIAQNSVYLYFTINLKEKSVEVHSCGHIYLSPTDQKNSYLAMASLKTITKAYGGKWLRKFTYKDPKHLAKKIKDFATSTFDIVKWYAGEYPYKQGIREIYEPRIK